MKECDFNEMWHGAGPYQSSGEEDFPWGEWEKDTELYQNIDSEDQESETLFEGLPNELSRHEVTRKTIVLLEEETI